MLRILLIGGAGIVIGAVGLVIAGWVLLFIDYLRNGSRFTP